MSNFLRLFQYLLLLRICYVELIKSLALLEQADSQHELSGQHIIALDLLSAVNWHRELHLQNFNIIFDVRLVYLVNVQVVQSLVQEQ